MESSAAALPTSAGPARSAREATDNIFKSCKPTTTTGLRTCKGILHGARSVNFAPVKAGPLVFVTDNRIGRCDFLEALGDRVVIGIAIGVQFLGELAVGFLEIGLAGRPVNAQCLIRIFHINRLVWIVTSTQRFGVP